MNSNQRTSVLFSPADPPVAISQRYSQSKAPCQIGNRQVSCMERECSFRCREEDEQTKSYPAWRESTLSISSWLRKPHCDLYGLVIYIFFFFFPTLRQSTNASLPRYCQRNVSTSKISLQRLPQMESIFTYKLLGKSQVGHENTCSGAIHPPLTILPW